MSQQKVDKYKQEKSNRSKLIKKEKRIVRLEIISIVGLMVILLGGFSYSYYNRLEKAKPATEYAIDGEAVENYLTELDAPAEEPLEDGEEISAEDTEEDEEVTEQ